MYSAIAHYILFAYYFINGHFLLLLLLMPLVLDFLYPLLPLLVRVSDFPAVLLLVSVLL